MAKNKSKKKQPKSRKVQARKIPSKAANVDSYLQQSPVWRLSLVDHDGKWGWKAIGHTRWEKDLLPKLQDFESMSWHEIDKASGGRRQGTNSHPIDVEKLCKEAQDRLTELNINDIDQVYSLRLQGEHRVIGIRENNILKIIWFDFKHEICVSEKKNT